MSTGTKRGIDDEDDDFQDDLKQIKSENSASNLSAITCELPPLCSANPQSFSSLKLFESHYMKFHSMNCVQCGKTFPSERILDLHITENHDPFAALHRERGEKIVRYHIWNLMLRV